MYKQVSSSLDFCSREKEVLEFWKENSIFEKSVKLNEGKPSFSFYDGPPTANGKPHIGHILTRVMKDIIPRYKTMKGYYVIRKAGWDTHGLPVELEVEKTLNMDGKQDIEKYGIEPFIQKCKESVWKYKGEWERMSERVGYWVDMEHPYITYDDNYIESEWWALKKIAEAGLLYKGHKIVPYCPRCGTALSSHEVAQGYKTVKEKSIFVKFKIKNSDGYFLAWTTTPWTLPSNVALCMNPVEDYVRIKAEDGEIYVLAEALAPSLFENYEVLETKKGKDYEYQEYIPLFDFYKGDKKAFYVTCDNYVTLTDGSGVVHIAPAFGEDDANVGRNYNLPFVQMVDDRGKFTAETGDLQGIFVKDGDKLVIEKLKEKGLLFKELMFEHSYPYCWRCDTPLLYYARSSWFIKMTEVRDRLLKNNATVNWMPPTIGTGRMGNFLENVIDWGVFENQFPADFISEAVDQTRGWFYTLLAVSTLIFDRAPFKNCIVLGHVNDKNGIKMSKHKGNVVDPWSVLDKQGADAVRWYFYSSSAPWLPSRFSAENVSEAQRKFMGTLWNTYSFFVLYAEIDKYDPRKYDLKKCKLSQIDRWALSNLNTLVATVDEYLDKYKITESARAIEEFTDNLSNWYVRRSRERFWGSDMTDDKAAAYTTLYHILVTMSKLLAPFVPFMAENIYQNLVRTFYTDAPESVHLSTFPEADKDAIDKDLESDMDVVLHAVALGRACRNKVNIKNRQPLSKLYVLTDKKLNDESVIAYIADEINVKEVALESDSSKFITYELKPQLKTLGPKYGKHLGAIKQYLSACDNAKEIVDRVRAGKIYSFEADGTTIELAEEDLLINPVNKSGYSVESESGMTVVIDTTLTPALIDEGIARELVSKLQTMRKEAGFEVVDHIEIGYEAEGESARVIENDKSILSDVLCDKLVKGLFEGYTKEWDINGEKVTLVVKKA